MGKHVVSPEATRFIYFAPSDVLIPRVDRVCIVKFCEALAELGVDMELVTLNIRLTHDEPTRSRSLWEVYGVTTPFKIRRLPSFVSQDSSERSIIAQRFLLYTWYVFRNLVLKRATKGHDVVVLYFKNYLLTLPLLVAKFLCGNRLLLMFEAHAPPDGRLAAYLLRRVDRVVCVSNVLASRLPSRFGVATEKIRVSHQGVDLRRMDAARVSRGEARERLGLSQDTSIAVYTGKLFKGYGEIELLLEAAPRLPEGALLLIVGGREDHVEYYRQRASETQLANVRFVGFVAPSEVLYYQLAADVLVMYYPRDIPLNEYRASPGKLFEYMAALVPIVAANLPALHEVITGGESAVFVEPDNPAALAEAIAALLENRELGARLACRAYEDVKEHTWTRRAERTLEFLAEAGCEQA